jgi:hypothetical protein
MSDPLKYLANAKDCLVMAGDAPNAEARQDWLDLADRWIGMVPQDLRTPADDFEDAARDYGTQQQISKLRH